MRLQLLKMAAMNLIATLFLTLVTTAQTFHVIHSFTGVEGGLPQAGLTIDRRGNLYGTTSQGGTGGFGTVFKLTPEKSGWKLSLLHTFNGGNNGGEDGGDPNARVIFGSDGSLYGTTTGGGSSGCSYCGTVFKLTPAPIACITCPWTETVLYRFQSGIDGRLPYSEVVFDQDGNIYGTTQSGGSNCQYGCGTVYELTPHDGTWAERVLYNFTGGADGGGPTAGLIFDNASKLYGTAPYSDQGLGGGTVFQLARSGSHWTENVLYAFQNGSDGSQPYAGLIFDGSGHLYGVTGAGGAGNGGTAFELTHSKGGWNYSLVYSLKGSGYLGPDGSLLMDSAGSLYGTTVRGGSNNAGTVFKLTFSNGRWTETVLHDFTGGSDGGNPYGSVVMDSRGNLYGTASIGGGGYGDIWEITP